MILELANPFLVETEQHGEGMAIILIDYGPHLNSVFVVILKSTREIKHYQSSQLKITKNFTFDYV